MHHKNSRNPQAIEAGHRGRCTWPGPVTHRWPRPGRADSYVMMGLAASVEVWKVVSSAASGVLLDIYLSGTQKPCSQAEMYKDRSTMGFL